MTIFDDDDDDADDFDLSFLFVSKSPFSFISARNHEMELNGV